MKKFFKSHLKVLIPIMIAVIVLLVVGVGVLASGGWVATRTNATGTISVTLPAQLMQNPDYTYTISPTIPVFQNVSGVSGGTFITTATFTCNNTSADNTINGFTVNVLNNTMSSYHITSFTATCNPIAPNSSGTVTLSMSGDITIYQNNNIPLTNTLYTLTPN